MNAVLKAARYLTSEVALGLREGGGCLPEADSGVAKINSASRRLIRAMEEMYGEVWFGKINNHAYCDARRKNQSLPALLWPNTGGLTCYNFGADFVLPKCDKQLEEMIRNWNENSASVAAYEAIYDRIVGSGGQMLFWS